MPVWVVLLLRLATASLFFGEAWLHWFAETGYAEALKEPMLSRIPLDPDWLDRILGGWFFLAGVVLILWRPKWIVGFTLLVSAIALCFVALCWWLPSTTQISTITGNAVLIAGPIIMLAGGVIRQAGLTAFLLRSFFTISFATFGILALGMPLEVGGITLGTAHSQAWLDSVDAVVANSPLTAAWVLRILGILTLVACVGLWIRGFSLVSAGIFALCGVISMVAVILANPMQGEWVDTLHLVAPEVLLRLPLVAFALALLFLQVLSGKGKQGLSAG